MDNLITKDTIYFQITDLWKRFCEEHSQLLDKTFDEYALLLESKIEELDLKISEKQLVIQNISGLEALRNELIAQINNEFPEFKINDVSDLLSFALQFEEEKKHKHLERFNNLLIDIIEKIQDQNKKNQLFINKAILSLQSIRNEALGKKDYKTYTRGGGQTSSVASK